MSDRGLLGAVLAAALAGSAAGQSLGGVASIKSTAQGGPIPVPAGQAPPKSWIDPDTHHRVIRLTDVPGSASFYFNDNSITPDGKEMVFTAGGGICVMELGTWKVRPLLAGPARPIVVGRKTPTLYYTKGGGRDGGAAALWAINIDTGENRKLADLPRRGGVSSINADETLAGGTLTVGEGAEYGAGRRPGAGGPGTEPTDKPRMMDERLKERLPMELFVLDLRTGERRTILRSTDWLNHLQFSPTDPGLLLYCHEGTWWKVDRIWTIRTDGSRNTLVHKRTMGLEAVGHEFWSEDGKTIYYDDRFPWGVDFFTVGYSVATGERVWYHVDTKAWSIHYNVSYDNALFCGDGGALGPVEWASTENQWIYLFRPERLDDHETLGENLIHPGVLHPERLVNLLHHNYYLEPNVFFTPDGKYVIFRSNLFGPTYIFAVEVARTNP